MMLCGAKKLVSFDHKSNMNHNILLRILHCRCYVLTICLRREWWRRRKKIKKCNFYVNKMTNFVFFISFKKWKPCRERAHFWKRTVTTTRVWEKNKTFCHKWVDDDDDVKKVKNIINEREKMTISVQILTSQPVVDFCGILIRQCYFFLHKSRLAFLREMCCFRVRFSLIYSTLIGVVFL